MKNFIFHLKLQFFEERSIQGYNKWKTNQRLQWIAQKEKDICNSLMSLNKLLRKEKASEDLKWWDNMAIEDNRYLKFIKSDLIFEWYNLEEIYQINKCIKLTFNLTLLPDIVPRLTTFERLNCKPISIYNMVISVIGSTNTKIVEIVKTCSTISRLIVHVTYVSSCLIPKSNIWNEKKCGKEWVYDTETHNMRFEM